MMDVLGMTVIGFGALGVFLTVIAIGLLVFDADHIADAILKIAFCSLGIAFTLALVGFFIAAFNVGWFKNL